MRGNYKKRLFKHFKDYIKIESERMKVDFDLFSSKLALNNLASLAVGLDEQSAKNVLVSNLKNYKELKNQRRLLAKKRK